MSDDRHGIRLSVVLATDTYATIRPVVDRLLEQSLRDEIEVVIVTPDPERVAADMQPLRDGLGGVQVLEIDDLKPLSRPRAVGIRASRGPLVFVGETHTYPRPGWAAGLVGAFERHGGAVVPVFGNANPGDGALSWAAFVSDYGVWGEGGRAGPLTRWPVYNTAVPRASLLALGDDLERALDPADDEARGALASLTGARLEPAARIDHLNVSRPRPWIRERYLVGRLVGQNRSLRWGPARRVAYALASPLIAVVLVWRVRKPYRLAARAERLPVGTVPAVILGMVVKSAGEAVGYLRRPSRAAIERMNEFEVRKTDFVRRAPRG